MSGHLLLYSPKTKTQLPVGQILRDALYHVTTASSRAEFESYAPHRIWDCLIILGGSPSLLHQLSAITPNQKMPIIVILEAHNSGCRMQFLRAGADEIFNVRSRERHSYQGCAACSVAGVRTKNLRYVQTRIARWVFTKPKPSFNQNQNA